MYDFLCQVPLFAGLAPDDLDRLCRMTDEVTLAAGEELFAEGSPGDRLYIIKSGELDIVKQSGKRDVLLSRRRMGEVIGEISLVQNISRIASARAHTDTVLYTLHKDHFNELLSTSPSATRTILNTVVARWHHLESMLRQSEKMAQLGTLAAGVAHELNNPAAAVMRAATQLVSAIEQFHTASTAVHTLGLSSEQQQVLVRLEAEVRQRFGRATDATALTRFDLENELEGQLEARGVPDAWERVSTLVDLNYTANDLEAMACHFDGHQLGAILTWVGALHAIQGLAREIGVGAERIADVVKALRSYTYLDQAPVQRVDVHAGLDNTLLILQHKLKAGIEVRREYAPDVPSIEGSGGALNQVWTNLIDNAADALEGQGQIVIRTRREDDEVIVEVEDNGPGIPAAIRDRVFDPFFTTKPPGHGTGLGLHITYNIVVDHHRGDIGVVSEPGRTCFSVRLPVQRSSGPSQASPTP